MSDIPHIGYIIAAYAVAAGAVVAMIVTILLDYRELTARLAELAARRDAPPR
jgi:heme exporter protein CcmD